MVITTTNYAKPILYGRGQRFYQLRYYPGNNCGLQVPHGKREGISFIYNNSG